MDSDSNFVGINEVDLGRLSLDKTVPLQTGGRLIKLKYEYRPGVIESLQIVTPDVYLPFGLVQYQKDDTIWSCDISFNNFETNPLIQQFLALIQLMDITILELAKRNCVSWFGKQYDLPILQDRYKNLLKDSVPPGKYPPRLKVHANPVNGVFPFKIINSEGIVITCRPDMNEVQKIVPAKIRARLLIEFPNLWFNSSAYGVSCRLQQILVLPENRLVDQPFLHNFCYNSEGRLVPVHPTLNSIQDTSNEFELSTQQTA